LEAQRLLVVRQPGGNHGGGRGRILEHVGPNNLYYEVYENQFDDERKVWQPFQADKSFKTEVSAPKANKLEGFDVVTFSVQTSPECSPLSCNGLAESIPVNAHCLLPSLEETIRLVESGAFDNSEPGPFRIFAVYSCDAA